MNIANYSPHNSLKVNLILLGFNCSGTSSYATSYFNTNISVHVYKAHAIVSRTSFKDYKDTHTTVSLNKTLILIHNILNEKI